MIGGFAGAGKSTLARRLGQTFCLPYYDTDLVSKAVADSSDFEGGNPAGVAFDVVWMLAEAYLRNECSLIFDQNMGRPWQWKRIREICDKVLGATQVIYAQHRVGEMGWGIGAAHWGQRFGTEAARIIIQTAFETIPILERLSARAHPENIASRRLMEKVGMVHEATIRKDRVFNGEVVDDVCYGILRQEWTV